MDTLLEVIRRRKGKGYKSLMQDDAKESDAIEGDGSVKSRQSKQQEDADGLAPKLKGDSENIEQVEQKNEEIEKRPTAEQLLGRKPMSTTKSREQEDEDDASDLDGVAFPDKTIFNEDALEQMINPVLQEQLSEGRKPKTLKDRVQMNIMKVIGKKKKTNQGEMNDDE
jgi:hypothetical protein